MKRHLTALIAFPVMHCAAFGTALAPSTKQAAQLDEAATRSKSPKSLNLEMVS